MKLKYLYSPLIILLIFLAGALPASALDIWDGVSVSTSLEGSGSQANPYLIRTGADLKYFADKVNQSTAGRFGEVYVELMDNIDLDGHEWVPIGQNSTRTFNGHFNGRGNVIDNMYICLNTYATLSDNENNANAAFGLFGCIGKSGSVENLGVENAVISASAPFNNSGCDFRIGFIAGSIESNAAIRGCVVVNGTVSDNGYQLNLRSVYVGGIVGNIAVTFTGYKNHIPGGSGYVGPIKVEYVAADIDVQLANTTISNASSSQYTQFNIGGIVGRMRRADKADIPDHVVATGRVNAPRATISPLFGLMRGNGENTKSARYLTRAYSGEYPKSTAETNDNYYVIGRSAAEEIDVTNRRFSNFRIYNSATHAYEDITDVYPPVSADRIFGTRTLEPNGTATGAEVANTVKFDMSATEATATTLTMRSFQGVNHSTYFSPDDASSFEAVEDMLGANPAGLAFAWSENDKRIEFLGNERVRISRTGAQTYAAKVDNFHGIYTYRWTAYDNNGNPSTVSVANGQGSNTGSGLTARENGRQSSVELLSDYRGFSRIVVELINSSNTVVCSYEVPVNIIEVDFARRIALDGAGHNDHYVFSPAFFCDDEIYGDIAAASDLSYEWEIEENGSWIPLSASTTFLADPTAPAYEAHVVSTYVGALRMRVFSTVPGYTINLTSHISGVGDDFLLQVIYGLQVGISIHEYNPADGSVSDFDPSHYYRKSGNNYSFYPLTYTDPTSGTVNDTAVKPLIFTATIIDQFGEEWIDTSIGDRWKVKWNYRIPGDGLDDERKSPNYDSTDPDMYNLVNGTFDAADPDFGIQDNVPATTITDWVYSWWQAHDPSSPMASAVHTGQFMVTDDGRNFIIHPNLLQRTFGFRVKATLYDVANDPDGEYPTVSIFAFNQLNLTFDRSVEGQYTGSVVYDLSNLPYDSDAECTFTWYVSDDPTDPEGWSLVKTETTTAKSSTISPVEEGKYYRLVFEDFYGVHVENIVSDKNIVFVYNREHTISHPEKHRFNPYDPITDYYYPDGSDFNTGHDPYNAVFTMKRAFQLIDANGGVDKNIIVIMGALDDYDFIRHSSRAAKAYAKPATITGRWGENISGGTFAVYGDLEKNSYSNTFYLSLQAPQKWENLDIYCNNIVVGQVINGLYLYNHDFFVGEGVRMVNFTPQGVDSGIADGTMSPAFTLVAGRVNDNTDMNSDAYKIDYSGNIDPNVTTVELHSGAYGRIILGARNTGGASGTGAHNISKNIYATALNPHRVRILIDIHHPTGDLYEFMPPTTLGLNYYKYTDEIGMLVGGQTDGSVYCDTEITMRHGHVTRFISGNITYGRSFVGAPDDSFFGSTVLNIYGGQIDELYGGCLGRHHESSVPAPYLMGYFYGRSVINLYGGTIADEVSRDGKIYAGGASCVSGLGHDWGIDATNGEKAYTCDQFIPYVVNGDLTNVQYGTYEDVVAPGHSMPVMQIYDSATGTYFPLDLSQTETQINLYGGIVYGDVYGGGLGFSNSLDYNKVPYRLLDNGIKQSLAGNLYGKSSVRMLSLPGGNGAVVTGSVYGGGSGSKDYITASNGEADAADFSFENVAQTFGDSEVYIEAGTVRGDVFAGSMGIEGHPDMGNIYGNTSLQIVGGEIEGNIYGGSAFSDVLEYSLTPTDTERLGGKTDVNISGGVIGNSIFGGGRGTATAAANVTGATNVTISGGEFSSEAFYYTYDIDGSVTSVTPKNFNIYGGSYVNGSVGSTNVNITSSPLVRESSLGLDDGLDFLESWNDLTVRRFCVYGGGWGESTLVLNDANVNIAINGAVPGNDSPVATLLPRQMFYDVCGGGFSGSCGRWVSNGKDPSDPDYDGYDRYEGGNVHLTISGNPVIRKVIGGGFYASVRTTETNIVGGTFEMICGGALLGYVHDKAVTNIGTRDAVDPNAAVSNRGLFILGNVYGGNDVKGIVGTRRWRSSKGEYGYESTDGGPLFQSFVDEDNIEKGVFLNIYGGTFLGDVYGAGNGHYRGYYVPGWARYLDGPARDYRNVPLPGSTNDSQTGKVYRSRPMTGIVRLNIVGNSVTDRVDIRGNVYGGGRRCTIGMYNTILPFDDPRRYAKGGFLHVNFGGHTTIGGNVYMGSKGALMGNQTQVPADVPDANLIDGSSTLELDRLGDAAYDHWYFDSNLRKYRLGFPKRGEVFTINGKPTMTGEHAFRGYLKNIEMNGDVQLTFFRNPLNADGTWRPWVPAEMAIQAYDATDIRMTNFYAGGESGSMTNNNVMRYTYTGGTEQEKFGSIYRISIPAGVTIVDKIVCGSQDAGSKYYQYTDVTGHNIDVDETIDAPYVFDGGFVTQRIFSYESMVHYDLTGSIIAGFTEENRAEVQPTLEYIATLPDPEKYTMTRGDYAGIEIHRQMTSDPNYESLSGSGHQLYNFGIATYTDEQGREVACLGPREKRAGVNVMKMATNCQFDAQTGDPEKGDNPNWLHGGLIYGGCYNSGTMMGDVILIVASDMLGNRLDPTAETSFGRISSLKYNLGRVYGGGYGEDALVDGDTFVNLILDFQGMNVFGGGHRGPVTGTTHVTYIGNEDSYVYGAIYGGGMRGPVGTRTPILDAGGNHRIDGMGNYMYDYPVEATHVELYSGNVDKVYGGSCMADLYGGTYVKLCDQIVNDLQHLDFNRVSTIPGFEQMRHSRLICGSVFGGNDITGEIFGKADTDTETYHDTYVEISEMRDSTYDPVTDTGTSIGKNTPGAAHGYNGFPLVGNVFGSGNGDYVTHHYSDYTTGVYFVGDTVDLATGQGTQFVSYDLGRRNSTLPSVNRASVNLLGGTIINAYGGGNNSTVNESVDITVNYADGNTEARAGFDNADISTRIWNIMHLSSDEQMNEVLRTNEADQIVYDYQIFHLYGGNDNADMAIQPNWNLQRGFVGSAYSGGNFGRMTYFNPDADPDSPDIMKRYRGLMMHVESIHMHINALYGGGRIGDIAPAVPDGQTFGSVDDYGSTLNIQAGVISAVYGGNDVSGVVHHGTNVNIAAAIAGDVYCAGNGNYRYFYDPSLTTDRIEEIYDDTYGGRYFRLPRRAGYGEDAPVNEQKVLAINSYRPNVERAYLNIEGSADNKVWVTGSVYCGGNSSTVKSSLEEGALSDIRFNIGSNVVLNSVYMGSNGENLIDIDMLQQTEALNSFDLTNANNLRPSHVVMMRGTDAYVDSVAVDKKQFPYLLDLYMRAVDVNGLPSDFRFSKTVKEAYIGDFFVGGNRGSMLTDRTIDLVFPEALTIMGHLTGGCNNANVTYKNVTHYGGLTRPLLPEFQTTGKVHLTVKSEFRPWAIEYPVNGNIEDVRLVPNVVDVNGKKYFPRETCTIIGGCYNSGTTVGNINIDLFSDMTQDFHEENKPIFAAYGVTSKIGTILQGINDLQYRTFATIGGGYGAGTKVVGDIRVRMLPGPASPSFRIAGLSDLNPPLHPSTATIFGGSQLGDVIGNVTVEVRDGKVFTNLYGGSESAPLYGSTQILVGWPDYYVCNTRGTYELQRADDLSKAALSNAVNKDNNRPAVLSEIKLREGEIVSKRVYDMMTAADKADHFTAVFDDQPHNFPEQTAIYIGDDGISQTITSDPFDWDDIEIFIGDPESRIDRESDFYAHGNIYGGGYNDNSSSTEFDDNNSVCKFRATHTPSPEDIGYGGNATILVWDNPENANLGNLIGQPSTKGKVLADGHTLAEASGAKIKDHVTISTGHFVPANVKVGQDVIGKYLYNTVDGKYYHQASHIATAEDVADNNYFVMESDGGIYGGGRKVFTEGFRTADIAYYGYADYTPQFPKMFNTMQRLDVASITDCCMELHGAQDFALNVSDATQYAMTRIGELNLFSSIHDYSQDLNPGEREEAGLYNVIHDTPRMRNYIAMYNSVRYVSAITSSTDFSDAFRGANGERYATDEFGPAPGGGASAPAMAPLASEFSYREFKQDRIDTWYAIRDRELDPAIATQAEIDALAAEKLDAKLGFDQRNVGTAANMIGINNGFVLRIQGALVNEQKKDEIYWGPIKGVVEVKLLTLATNEGGGYIYALNQHDNTPEDFLETTGNFVFPGAAYMISEHEERNYNYISDDCDPMHLGFDYYKTQDPTGQVEDQQDVHYWYVNGNNYYYEITLTAITYNNSKDFFLDKADQLVYLYGVAPGTKFKMKSVVWENSNNSPSDFQDFYQGSGNITAENPYTDYQLYLSVDRTTDHVRTLQEGSEHAFVTRISRTDYDASADPADELVPYKTNPDDVMVNNYSDYSATDLNTPMLGITLCDNVDNSDPEYYEKRLEQPEVVRLTLEAEVEDETGAKRTFTYTVNLRIVYLLGPVINGDIVVENCALPGEYVFANAFNVDVKMDADMVVNERKWYLIGPDENPDNISSLSDTERIDLEAEKFGGDFQVHIPAYWYLNGYQIVYAIVANNMPFYISPSTDTAVSPESRMVVHNYHRARPYDGTSVQYDSDGNIIYDADGVAVPRYEDLFIVAGSHIYIEDDDDLAHLLTMLSNRQTKPTRRTITGLYINPQYGDSLEVHLLADVTMPDDFTANNTVSMFTLHGNGHTINLGNNPYLVRENRGKVYNTGFVSSASSDTHAFAVNSGLMENCYFFNTADSSKGALIGSFDSTDDNGVALHGACINSYQVAPSSLSGIHTASESRFRDGTVAYNLNRHYLERRYGNNVDYLEAYYADGDYRYANWSTDGNARALRTAARPNYRDYRGVRINIDQLSYDGTVTGADATFHNIAGPVDETRWSDVDNKYHPNFDNALGYPNDYLMFGQSLSRQTLMSSLPASIDLSPRVYRASGFYRSKTDQGFHYNEDAFALASDLTAIDFGGYRDNANPGAAVGFCSAAQGYADQQVFYPPMIDAPAAGIASFDVNNGASVDDDVAVTRNLLVYHTPDIADKFASFAYTETTPSDDIRLHAMPAAADFSAPQTDLFHLVDLQDFNAPIAFDVTKRAWYDRSPVDFSCGSGSEFWEGLCLPFTSTRVLAEDKDGESVRSHGEITHFYGDQYTDHEYWVRKFTGVNGDKAFFDRPASAADVNVANPADETNASYGYANTWFADIYGIDYTANGHNRPQYTSEGVTWTNYPMLTQRTPYIVSFPGERFYEFDLSGWFFKKYFGLSRDAVAQRIIFDNTVVDGADAIAIPVSDNMPPVDFVHDGHTFRGTYMRHQVTSAQEALIDHDEYNGSALTRSHGTVMPFRAFLVRPSSDPAPLHIASRSIDSINPADPDDEDIPEETAAMQIFVNPANELCVIAPEECTLTLYNLSGQALRILEIEAGTNTFSLPAGFYLLADTKFRIN